jgi:hypothetical protein
VFDVLLSITNNVVVLVDLKTMIMNFISKTLNPTSIATPFNPKSALEQQQARIVESPLGEPTLNTRIGTIPCIANDAHFTIEFNVDGGGENIKTKSKKKEGIVKDGLGPFKQCQRTHGKKKRRVTITKVLADVVELWNELTNGSSSFNSLAKVDVVLDVQNNNNKESLAKCSRAMG